MANLGVDTQLPTLTPELLQLGMRALQSGAIDPAQAAQNFRKFSPYALKQAGPLNKDQAPLPDVPADGPMPAAAANQQQVIAQTQATQASPPPGSVVQQQQPGLQAPALRPLSPQPIKSGLSETEISKAVQGHKTTDVSGKILGKPEYDEAKGRLDANEAYKNLLGGANKLQGMLDMEAGRKAPMDWKPLAAMVDSWKGGSLAAGLPTAETPQDRAKRLLEYSQKLQQDKKGIVDAFSNNLKAQKAGMTTDMTSLVQSIQDQQAAQDPYKYMRSQSPEMRLKWVNDAADRQLKPLEKEYEGVQHGMDLLSKASSVADLSAVDAYLKSQVGGRVTNYDLQRQKGDQSWGPRIAQAVETVTNGTLTPQNRAEYAQALQIIGQAINGERNQRLGQVKDFSGTIGNDPAATEQLLRGYFRADEVPKGEARKAVQATTAAAAPKIRVQKPDGTIGSIPAENAKKLPAGWKVLK